jgi:Mn2+/Fe2+ NRAMP family transporter
LVKTIFAVALLAPNWTALATSLFSFSLNAIEAKISTTRRIIATRSIYSIDICAR